MNIFRCKTADWDRNSRFYCGGVVPLRPFGVGFPVELEQLRPKSMEENFGADVKLEHHPARLGLGQCKANARARERCEALTS